MKTINKLMILFGVVLSFTSCKKFLEESPNSLVATSTFYQTDDEAIAAVNSIYAASRADVTGGTPHLYFTELVADDGAFGGTALGERLEVENVLYNSQHSYVRTIWTNAYKMINLANNVIFYVDSAKVKPATARRVIAEARFFRAFSYFRLVQLYGDVPLLLQPTTSANLNQPRTATQKVYEQIIADLQYAENNLSAYYAYTDARNGGRATAAAAKALLGKVYLTNGGFPLKDATKFQLAADKLKELIDNKGTYNLEIETPFSWIFDVTKKADNTENLFYYRGTSGLAPSSLSYTRMKYNFVQYSMVLASKEVRTIGATGFWESGDLRRVGTINTSGYINKYIDKTTPLFNDNQDDLHNIRYSDVLLMYAEALIELNRTTQDLDDALTIINDLRRKHGGVALLPLTYATQDELRQKLRIERRKELMFEGQRYYDLKRWNIFVTTMQASLANQYGKKLEDYSYIDQNTMLLPIPYLEILNNPNLSQNPGY